MASAAFKFATGLFGLLILGFAGIHFGGADDIERRLASAANAALDESGIDWAVATLDGRDATITGAPPGSAARDRAVRIVREALDRGPISAARSVSFVETAPKADPIALRWRAIFDGAGLLIEGEAPGAAAKAKAAEEAAALFNGMAVNDASIVVEEDNDGAWLKSISLALHALSLLDAGSVDAEGLTLTMTGTASDPAHAEGAAQTIQQVAAPYSGVSLVEIADPSPLQTPSSAADGAAAPAGEPTIEGLIAETISPAPDIPAGDAADPGCVAAVENALDGLDITFRSDRAIISDRSAPALEALAEALNGCAGVSLEIVGHTDSTGPSTANQRLSQERAEAIAAYLESQGVEGTRLAARGAGESEPRASNNSEEGRSLNRRVDFHIVNSQAPR